MYMTGFFIQWINYFFVKAWGIFFVLSAVDLSPASVGGFRLDAGGVNIPFEDNKSVAGEVSGISSTGSVCFRKRLPRSFKIKIYE